MIREWIFGLLYPIQLRAEGNPVRPIRRRVAAVEGARLRDYDELLRGILAGNGEHIDYSLPYAKADFLNYLGDWCGLVLHGTARGALRTLEPIRLSHDSTDFGNLKQIFCSPDAIWAMWFAILDKGRVGTTRNGCVRVGAGLRKVKYYHFALPTAARDRSPFTEGTVYVARAEDFRSRHRIPALEFFGGDYEEWGSSDAVRPLARINVSPSDFPYLDQVGYYL